MNKIFKFVYIFITSLFTLLTIYEIYSYMTLNSNYIGIFYLFFNFFVMFLLFTVSYNYDFASRNIRISKNIISIIVGVIASFLLAYFIPTIFDYSDDSYLFSNSIYIISKIIKPILYLLLGGVSVFELKFNK